VPLEVGVRKIRVAVLVLLVAAPVCAQSAKQRFRVGEQHVARGEMALAVAEFRSASELKPRNKKFRQRLEQTSIRLVRDLVLQARSTEDFTRKTALLRRAEAILPNDRAVRALSMEVLAAQAAASGALATATRLARDDYLDESTRVLEPHARIAAALPEYPRYAAEVAKQRELDRGFASALEGDLDSAAKVAERVLQADSRHPRARRLASLVTTTRGLGRIRDDLTSAVTPKQFLLTSRSSIKSGRASGDLTQQLETINVRLLTELTEQLGLTERQSKAALARLLSNSEDRAERYVQDVRSYQTAVANSSRTINPQEPSRLLEFEATHSIEPMSKALSELACEIALLSLDDPIPFVAKPCELVATILLTPYLNALRKEGMIHDLVASRSGIRRHVRRLAAELTTVRDEYSTDIRKVLSRRTLRIFHSTAEVNLEFEGMVSAGFDLSRLTLTVDEATGAFHVSLPQPKILSVESDPSIETLRQGILVKIEPSHLNEIFREGKQTIRKLALDSGILDQAKANARTVLAEIFRPLTDTPYAQLTLHIGFAGEPLEIALPPEH